MNGNAKLVFEVFTADETTPINNAKVQVTNTTTGRSRIVSTDGNGRTPELLVNAPMQATSLNPQYAGVPYSLYNAQVLADGFTPVRINGIQIFAGQTAIQPVELVPRPVNSDLANMDNIYNIPPNALQQTYVNRQEYDNREPRVLREVTIPEYITVHLGRPDNGTAKNVTVTFPDYIKNVASSEIYPTWPESALRANIYAQISIALNRIYTEWYRSRGYNFDITNSTSYDQYYVDGRNIFANISQLVDDIFNTYIRKKGTVNPFYAEYCNGTTVTCKGMSQWGTVDLANKGLSPINILKNYYGNDVELATTTNIQAVQTSYPGFPLRQGTVSDDVIVLGNQLNRIRRNYPSIPEITRVTPVFTAQTEAAVKAFQKIFNLTQDGIVGPATWNKISYIYVAVKKLAELGSEGETTILPEAPPTVLLKLGSTGDFVKLAQYFLRVISNYNFNVSPVEIDGIYGPKTRGSVIDFQNAYGLAPDGIIGPMTWNLLYSVYMGIANTSGLAVAYPGYLLKEGSRGTNVQLMQEYLNGIAKYQLAIPRIDADGIFGPKTKEAVKLFQQLYNLDIDGIIGKNTWDRIVAIRMLY